MRIKSIIFIYPMKLSERQENILIVNLRAIKKKAIEDMENASKNLLNSNMKFIAKDQFEMISTKLDIVSKMARSEMKLEKDPKRDAWLLKSAMKKLSRDELRVVLEVGALIGDPLGQELLRKLLE